MEKLNNNWAAFPPDKYDRMRKAGVAKGAILGMMQRDFCPRPPADNVAKYARMQKAGVPAGAIVQTITLNSMASNNLTKYARMAKAGVSPRAIVNALMIDSAPNKRFKDCKYKRMRQAGVCAAGINRTMEHDAAAPPGGLGKYVRMRKAGEADEVIIQEVLLDALMVPAGAETFRTFAQTSKTFRTCECIAGAIVQTTDPHASPRPRTVTPPLVEDKTSSLAKLLKVGLSNEAILHKLRMRTTTPNLAKYARMRRAGVADHAVLNAMQVDSGSGRGVVFAKEDCLNKYTRMHQAQVPWGAIAQAIQTDAFHPPQRRFLIKYEQMRRAQVPPDAIMQRMHVDSMQTNSMHLIKYERMRKAKVDPEAVVNAVLVDAAGKM